MKQPRRWPGPALMLAASLVLIAGTAHADFAVPAADLEGFLGLPEGELDGFGNGPAIQGSAIRQVLGAEAGDILSFRFNFLTNEPEPFSPLDAINHFSFVSLVDSLGQIVLSEDLADVIGSSGFPLMSSATRFAWETGYQNFEFTLPTSGVFTLGIGVVSVTDALFESGLLIDSLTLTDSLIVNPGFETGDFTGYGTIGFARIETSAFGSGPADGQFQALISTVPEPGSMVLMAVGLAGALVARWRRGRTPTT